MKTGDPGRDRGFESHPLRFLKEALEDFISLGVFLLLNLLSEQLTIKIDVIFQPHQFSKYITFNINPNKLSIISLYNQTYTPIFPT